MKPIKEYAQKVTKEYWDEILTQYIKHEDLKVGKTYQFRSPKSNILVFPYYQVYRLQMFNMFPIGMNSYVNFSNQTFIFEEGINKIYQANNLEFLGTPPQEYWDSIKPNAVSMSKLQARILEPYVSNHTKLEEIINLLNELK